MIRGNSSVALAARAHPRGGPHSGDSGTLELLRKAAAAVGRESPDALSGPSAITADGTLLLPMATAESVLGAIRIVADQLRPSVTTFCVAILEDGTARESHAPEAPAGESVDSMLMAADSAARAALQGIDEADVKERRVRVVGWESDHALEALIDLVLVTYDGMTDRQRQIVALARSSETQQQVATHLDVSRQAVNQSLASAEWSHLKRAEDIIRRRFASGSDRASGGSPLLEEALR